MFPHPAYPWLLRFFLFDSFYLGKGAVGLVICFSFIFHLFYRVVFRFRLVVRLRYSWLLVDAKTMKLMGFILDSRFGVTLLYVR